MTVNSRQRHVSFYRSGDAEAHVRDSLSHVATLQTLLRMPPLEIKGSLIHSAAVWKGVTTSYLRTLAKSSLKAWPEQLIVAAVPPA